MALTPSQLERYSRQIILPTVGGRGQEALLNSTVALVGCGGLGSAVALALAGAGVGRLVLIDDDRVELSNLHRQLAFVEADLGAPKAEALAGAVRARADTELLVRQARIERSNFSSLVGEADLVVDGSDNFATRFAVADACAALGFGLITGAVTGHSGQLFAQAPGGKPCYRCLFEREPEQAASCSADGVLPGAVMTIAGMMAQWALLTLMNRQEVPHGRLLHADLARGQWRSLTVRQRPDCLCSDEKHQKLAEYGGPG